MPEDLVAMRQTTDFVPGGVSTKKRSVVSHDEVQNEEHGHADASNSKQRGTDGKGKY